MTRGRRGGGRRPAAAPRPPAAAPADPAPGRGGTLAVVAALTAAWAFLFLPQVLGRTFVYGDAVFYRAYGDFSQQRWEQLGERTLWNPYVFFGIASYASLADPRPQWLPGPLLSFWDAFTRGPAAWLLGPPLLAHLAGMIAAAFLARRLWRASAGAMLVAGLTWGLAPNIVVPFALGHEAQTVAVGFIPVVLWAAHVVLTTATARRARAAALALAAAVALQILGGHPQFVVYGAFALIVVAWLARREAVSRGRWLVAGGGLALGAAMAAALWVPAWLYLGSTLRGTTLFALGNSRDFSLALRDLLAAGWARAVGFGGAGYWGGQRATDYANTLGVLGCTLAVVAVVAGWNGSRRGTVRGLTLLGVVATGFALGINLPLLGRVLLGLPLLNTFRTPSTWMVLAQLAGALLAAHGFDRVRALAARRAGALRLAGLALIVAALVLAAARPALEQAWSDAAFGGFRVREAARILNTDENEVTFRRMLPEAAARAVADLLLRVAVLGGFALAVTWRRDRLLPAAFAAIAVLGFVDLGSVTLPETRGYTGPRTDLTAPPAPPHAAAAAADPLHRVYALDTRQFFSNDWIAWRARTVSGLHGATPRWWGEVRRNNLLLWDGFVRAVAVRYVGGREFAVQDSARYELVNGVLARRDALPRAYAVGQVAAAAHDSLVVQAMARPDFDPAAVAHTTDAWAAGAYPGSAGAAIAWRADTPDAIELEVRAAADAFVVVADAWFPGWSATLDGAPARMARVNHALRGVAVPAGAHVVAMRYVPPGWGAGRALALGGWALWLALAAALGLEAARSRASRPAPPAAPAPA